MSLSIPEQSKQNAHAPAAAADSLWRELQDAAREIIDREKELKKFLSDSILERENFADALGYLLAGKLADDILDADTLRADLAGSLETDASILDACLGDMDAVLDRDPACTERLTPFLYYKGFHALQAYRITRQLWLSQRRTLALHLQSRSSERFGVDIHPGARIGKGIMIDHATGVVIGETAVVEDNVSMLHGVTLGGTGKECGDRHPKVRRGVLLSAGATVLGNIEIGECARIGAGSIVLRSVPPYCTAVGVPARLIHCPDQSEEPALEMDHMFPQEPDYSI
ncbi:MAG: serine O-acetyltransferase [Hyphomicrobiales bacterium]|nr:serine O-acetyltransferase [Hyphomicrobiales bacterium]MCY4032889.1 serine O-acetyltransferase [Hyphomicrobiales bacterium]MCY4039191.1 serine O-acetyltransferase [Hyphomicrobiales bacterium]